MIVMMTMILHKGPGSEGSTYDRLFGQKTQNQFSNFPLIKKKKKKKAFSICSSISLPGNFGNPDNLANFAKSPHWALGTLEISVRNMLSFIVIRYLRASLSLSSLFPYKFEYISVVVSL